MKRPELLIVLGIVAVVVSLAVTIALVVARPGERTTSLSSVSFVSLTQGTTAMGDAEFTLTPRYENGKLIVTMTESTHSVDMSPYDLRALTTLTIDGKQIAPSDAPRMSGHHNSGELVFAVTKEPSEFTITITGIPATERIYTWT